MSANADAPDAAPTEAPPIQPEPKPEPEPQPKPEPPPAPAPERRVFVGNQTASKIVEAFARMEMIRQFDDVDAKRLEAMGFTQETGSLKVEAASGSIELEVGKQVFGGADSYVRRKDAPSVVYVIASDKLGPLQHANARLVERRLIVPESNEFATIDFAYTSGTTFRVVHKDRSNASKAVWVFANKPDAASTELAGYVEKVFRLTLLSIPPKGKEPKANDLEQLLTITLSGDPGKHTVAIARGTKDDGSQGWFAQSANAPSWVPIEETLASDLVDNLATLAPQ